MWKDGKYKKWYFAIIDRAILRSIDSSTYYEKHHIQPKSLNLEYELSIVKKLKSQRQIQNNEN